MLDKWRISILVPLQENKDYSQSCSNCSVIKLMSHIMRFWRRIIKQRLRKETFVMKNQFGFIPERLTMQAIYLIQRLIEKYE